jgi:hypothetical protein
MNTVALINQTLLDIAVQMYGNAEAAFDLARANNISITDNLQVGAVLGLPTDDSVGGLNRPVANYFKNRGIKPATAITIDTDDNRIFNNALDLTFN